MKNAYCGTYYNEMYLRNLLARNAAPVFAKKKPAGLLTIWKYHFQDFDFLDYLEENKSSLLGGCSYEIILETPLYYQLFYYQKKEVEHVIREIKSSYLLSEYAKKDELKEQIMHLKEKLQSFYILGKEFPHEIGLFLGYPVWDVEGFIKHNGENYKLCGYWKVYDDLPGAIKKFREYDLLKTESVKRFQQDFERNNHKKI